MELYILSKQDLSILSICKLSDYQINLDEETNAKSTFTLMKTEGLKKDNFMVLNGLYRQFLFIIYDVQTEKGSDAVTVTALDISNIFDRKVIEKNTDTMTSKSVEEFIANTMSENFVNSNDTALNVSYIDIYWHTSTKGTVATNAENGLYNFHTFLTNCRQYKNIYTDFSVENIGNPQTIEDKSIKVDAKGRKSSISLRGETNQSTTISKNLLPNKIASQTIKGVDVVVGEDGSITLNGTATSSITLYSLGEANAELFFDVGDYTISSKTSGTSDKDVTFMVLSTDFSFYGGGACQESFSTTFNVANGGNAQIGLNILKGTILDNLKIYLQIEKGTVATEYEAYGVSPSENIPSEIQNIEGNIEVKVTNGLDVTDTKYQEKSITFPLSEGQKLMEGSCLADDGIHNVYKEKLVNGTSSTFEDAKENGKFYCNMKISGNLETQTISFEKSVTNAIVQYELAEEEILPYTEEQQKAYDQLQNLILFEGTNHISSTANMILDYYPENPIGIKLILNINIQNKEETTELIDTTLPEVTDYNKIYEEDVTAKVQVYIREDGSEYNLYLKTDRTTTTNKDDPDRANGKIEVISVDTADRAEEEALNVMKGNNYKHLVEFKIAKTSKLMDITKLHIGRPIRIKTDDDIYDSYISAITLSDENFVYFKSGSMRNTLIDKLKKNKESVGNKVDVNGGKINGDLDIKGNLLKNGVLVDLNDSGWQDITILHGEAHSNSNYKAQYRKVGNRVDLCGFINNVTTLNVDLFVLPSGFYNPKKRITFATTNDKRNINAVRVYQAGSVRLIATNGDIASGINVGLDGISFYID